MFVWDYLGGKRAVALLVTEAYAAYRRPIAAALRFFVENLPGPRAVSIAGDLNLIGGVGGPNDSIAPRNPMRRGS